MLCVKHDVVVTILLLSWENLSRIKSIFSSSMISSYHTAASRWTHSARKRWAVILLCFFYSQLLSKSVLITHYKWLVYRYIAVFSFPELTLQSSFTCSQTHTHTTAFCSFYISLIENKTSIVVLTGWEIIDGHRFNTLCFSSLVWNWWVWWFLPQSNISWYPVNMHKQQKLQPPFLSVCLQTLIPQGFPLNHSHAVSRSCCVTCYPIMTRENEASLRKEANMQWHVQVWETLRHRMGPVTANSTVELNA